MVKSSYRTICMAGALLACTLVLAACGNDYGPSVQSPQAETTVSPPAVPATIPEAGPEAPRVAAQPAPGGTVESGPATNAAPAGGR